MRVTRYFDVQRHDRGAWRDWIGLQSIARARRSSA
jgi:hypothetical protein